MDDDELTPEEQAFDASLRSAFVEFPVTDEVAELVHGAAEPVPPRAIARTMVDPLERAYAQEGRTFPRFAALLAALRFSTGGVESVASRLDLPASLVERFEHGDIHPAWFPMGATRAAARIVASEADWRSAIESAQLMQDAHELAPAADEREYLVDPWADADSVNTFGRERELVDSRSYAMVADSIELDDIKQGPGLVEGTRVRWTISGELGQITRRVAGELFEVSLASGLRFIPTSELVPAVETLRDRVVEKRIGRMPLFAHRLQSMYLLHAFRYDEFAGLNSARIEPRPHQVFTAWRVLQKVRPRMILADEVGLGKTIEAGIIVKELQARQLAERLLVVVPASLVTQWMYEFKSKFNIELEMYDGAKVKELKRRGHDNPWNVSERIICSMPFAARDSIAAEIAEAEWDVVVFDEAHRVRRHRSRQTKAYRLADELRFNTYGMLLLTATPMQLDSYELFSLIELIEPGLFPAGVLEFDRKRSHIRKLNDLMQFLEKYEGLSHEAKLAQIQSHLPDMRRFLDLGAYTPEEAMALLDEPGHRAAHENRLMKEHPLVEVMVRNRKTRIPDVFAQRTAHSVRVQPSDHELQVYENVTEYVREGFNQAKRARNMTAGFLMVVFQKMLTSSSYALRRSFQRRIHKLGQSLDQDASARPRVKRRALAAVGANGGSGRAGSWSDARLTEWADVEEQSVALDDALDSILQAEAIRAEIAQLHDLVGQLESVEDSKLRHLEGLLAETFSGDPTEKVIIFTQFIETQAFLRERLEDKYSVQMFNGSQRLDEKDRAIQRFRERDQILISTEAGGEGRNFQFAHIVVNYDLPWNPMRIEQRIGRVDRIGQKRDVVVVNLFVGDTLDERVMTVLQDRINVFEESIGSLDPILGDVEDRIRHLAFEVPKKDEEAAFQQLSLDLQQRVHQAKRMEEQLRDFIMDRNSLRMDEANRLLERKPLAGQEDLKRFVASFLKFWGGSIDEHARGGDVLTLPMRLAQRLRARDYRARGTFEPLKALEMEELQFFAIGHPLIDRILEVGSGQEEDAEVCAYAEGGGNAWSVDNYYRVILRGVKPLEYLVRTRSTGKGDPEIERLANLPSFGDELQPTDINLLEEDIESALQSSEQVVAKEVDSIHAEMQSKNEEALDAELARAERIFEYRKAKELDTIRNQEELLQKIKYEASSERQRVLPAIQGRIDKARERLERVVFDHEQEVQAIERRARLSVTFEFLGTAFVRMSV